MELRKGHQAKLEGASGFSCLIKRFPEWDCYERRVYSHLNSAFLWSLSQRWNELFRAFSASVDIFFP